MNIQVAKCSRCTALLPREAFNAVDFLLCPSCRDPIRVDVFPALFKTTTPGQPGETLLVESESSCFYHQQKKAVTLCESCGRFLCALCDVELNDQHLCPSCLETGKKMGKLSNLENYRMLYDNGALGLAILPAFLIWPTIVTAPMTLFVAVRYWKAPSSIIPRTKLRFVIAIALATLQILGWTGLLYVLIA
jgi:hypothetical protein